MFLGVFICTYKVALSITIHMSIGVWHRSLWLKYLRGVMKFIFEYEFIFECEFIWYTTRWYEFISADMNSYL